MLDLIKEQRDVGISKDNMYAYLTGCLSYKSKASKNEELRALCNELVECLNVISEGLTSDEANALEAHWEEDRRISKEDEADMYEHHKALEQENIRGCIG